MLSFDHEDGIVGDEKDSKAEGIREKINKDLCPEKKDDKGLSKAEAMIAQLKDEICPYFAQLEIYDATGCQIEQQSCKHPEWYLECPLYKG